MTTTLAIAKEFSKTICFGTEHAHQFLEELLLPRFLEAKAKGGTLLIDLDGVLGYPTCFLRSAFGGLAKIVSPKDAMERLQFVSNDEPLLPEEIGIYINEVE